MLGWRQHRVKSARSVELDTATPDQRGSDIDSQAGMSAGAFAPARGIPSEPRGRVHGKTMTKGTTEDVMSLSLDGGPEAAGHARRALARLPSDLDPPLIETMRLLV